MQKNITAKKIAMFTDIHFGKKNNSIQHNQDCLDFINWFCNIVKQEKNITHIIFLGDWFENRNSVNILTLNFALDALKQLNSLHLPIYIIVGNHDLYHRENRNIFSTKIFEELSNVTLISNPTIVDNDLLICPYLFKDEYSNLAKFNKIKYWFGHFEFKNFVVTGSNRVMEHGPDHTLFKQPKYIFSGHFHKRQCTDNIIYIGNTFPMDYGDVDDDERGMAILDTTTDSVEFINWDECPKYKKIKLSNILEGSYDNFPNKCRVRCIIDIDINYSDAQALKEGLIKDLGLREFSLEENIFEKQDMMNGDIENIDNFDLGSLNDAVIKMLETGISSTVTIDPKRLIEIYQQL